MLSPEETGGFPRTVPGLSCPHIASRRLFERHTSREPRSGFDGPPEASSQQLTLALVTHVLADTHGDSPARREASWCIAPKHSDA